MTGMRRKAKFTLHFSVYGLTFAINTGKILDILADMDILIRTLIRRRCRTGFGSNARLTLSNQSAYDTNRSSPPTRRIVRFFCVFNGEVSGARKDAG